MVATVVQSKKQYIEDSATPTLTFDSTCTLGNVLIAILDTNDTVLSTPSGWTQVIPDVSAPINGAMYYKISDGTETNVVWPDDGPFTGGQDFQAWFKEWSGLAGTSPIETLGDNSLGSETQSLSTGTSSNTIVDDVLCISYIGGPAGPRFNDGSNAWSNGFSIDYEDFVTFPFLNVAEKIISTAGTVETTFSTDDTGDQMIVGLMLWEIAGAGTASVDDVNGNEVTVDGEQGVTFTTTNFASGITSFKLKSGTAETLATILVPTEQRWFLDFDGSSTYLKQSSDIVLTGDREVGSSAILPTAATTYTLLGELASTLNYFKILSTGFMSISVDGSVVTSTVAATKDSKYKFYSVEISGNDFIFKEAGATIDTVTDATAAAKTTTLNTIGQGNGVEFFDKTLFDTIFTDNSVNPAVLQTFKIDEPTSNTETNVEGTNTATYNNAPTSNRFKAQLQSNGDWIGVDELIPQPLDFVNDWSNANAINITNNSYDSLGTSGQGVRINLSLSPGNAYSLDYSINSGDDNWQLNDWTTGAGVNIVVAGSAVESGNVNYVAENTGLYLRHNLTDGITVTANGLSVKRILEAATPPSGGTVNLPDVSAYTEDTVGAPFTSASHAIVYELSDGTDTDSLAGTHNPKTGWAVQEITSAVTTEGSVFKNFSAAPIDTSQVYYDDHGGTTSITATGIITTDQTADFTIQFWDASDDTWKQILVEITPIPSSVGGIVRAAVIPIVRDIVTNIV